MAEDRPAIPEPIKREVRQRCGFGCVICGLPIYEYEHMEEWAIVQRHVADEITLLCPTHHAEKTKKLLPVAKVKGHNARPRNIRAGQSAPHQLHYDGTSVRFELGGNWFSRTNLQEGDVLAPIVIDAVTLLGFTYTEGQLLLTLKLYDEAGAQILTIEESELTYSTGIWDIEFVGKTLTIRQGKANIWLEIEFRAPDTVRITRAKIAFNGICLLVMPHCLIANSVMLTQTTAANVPFGMVFGNSPGTRPCCFHIDVPRADRISFADAEKQAKNANAKEREWPRLPARSRAPFVPLPGMTPALQILVNRWVK
ncbi:hypothetical protein D9M68_474040 [compost metagenome]